MDKVEKAAERVMTLAQEEANPHNMTQSEAVEFWQLISSQASDWAETIQGEVS